MPSFSEHFQPDSTWQVAEHPSSDSCLLLLYYCFTNPLLLTCFTTALLLIPPGSWRSIRRPTQCCKTALLLLYYCFTTALLLLYYCCTTTWQVAEHPSSDSVLPSSQFSRALPSSAICVFESPHMTLLQTEEEPTCSTAVMRP